MRKSPEHYSLFGFTHCVSRTGAIPEALGALSKLKTLGLSLNDLTGKERALRAVGSLL